MDPEELPLPGGGTLAVVRALDNVVGCDPVARLLVVRDPDRGVQVALRLDERRVEVGPVPEPGEAFRPAEEVPVRGLQPKWMKAGLKVTLRARVWSIGAR